MSDHSPGLVWIVNGDVLGHGDDELGRRLMGKFVLQLSTQSPKPDVIAFYNTGVKLLADPSPYLDGFRTLEAAGTDLIACGTCVDHFRLRDNLGAGRISDMSEIVATALKASKVITV